MRGYFPVCIMAFSFVYSMLSLSVHFVIPAFKVGQGGPLVASDIDIVQKGFATEAHRVAFLHFHSSSLGFIPCPVEHVAAVHKTYLIAVIALYLPSQSLVCASLERVLRLGFIVSAVFVYIVFAGVIHIVTRVV